MILPDEIPLFPLPNVVLFPDAYLPLHIFEDRYRTMTRQALGGTRLIGMTVLRETATTDGEGVPPIYATGCAGASDSLHDTSAGSTSVAICPGGVSAAATASAASRGKSLARSVQRSQCDIGRASPAISELSGAFFAR